jgi:hypothetical protein
VGTTAQEASTVEPARLTIEYTENEDGWVTAQIVEYPAAISQGATRHEAWLNVLNALRDLTHQPTLAERVAFAVEALLAELGEWVGGLPELRDRLIGAAAERGRDLTERGRTGVH